MDGWKLFSAHRTLNYGMGHEKVPVFCKTRDRAMEILCSVSVPVSFNIFPCLFFIA